MKLCTLMKLILQVLKRPTPTGNMINPYQNLNKYSNNFEVEQIYLHLNKSGASVTISSPNIASSVINTGEEEEGLGRWLYVTYGGKNKKRVTIISAYRTLLQTTTKAYLRHIHNNGIF